jgi:hypothetical protein
MTGMKCRHLHCVPHTLTAAQKVVHAELAEFARHPYYEIYEANVNSPLARSLSQSDNPHQRYLRPHPLSEQTAPRIFLVSGRLFGSLFCVNSIPLYLKVCVKKLGAFRAEIISARLPPEHQSYTM